jgi:DNA-binding LytR/AlgR family response regulator
MKWIFLDLNMPKLKGFDFLNSLPNAPNVIVTTAYKEHALEGYELNVIDYLLKPVSFERFIKAINKIETKKASAPVSNVQKSDENSGTIFLRSNKKHVQVRLDRILFIEAVGNYCKVVTMDEEIRVREKISEFVKLLGEGLFFQVHKSFIVAKEHIEIVEGNRIGILDFRIPIGKLYKGNVDEILG